MIFLRQATHRRFRWRYSNHAGNGTLPLFETVMSATVLQLPFETAVMYSFANFGMGVYFYKLIKGKKIMFRTYGSPASAVPRKWPIQPTSPTG
jgi:hypothetical protein